jgi:hypothetical protein
MSQTTPWSDHTNPRMTMQKHNAVDYLHSADNLVYTPWKRIFAWFPVTTISKNKVWLSYVFQRKRKIKLSIPQFPDSKFNRTEYATLENIFERKLKGLD